VVDCYDYDAYGVMLGGNPNHSAPAATSLLYAGEHFDTDSQNYYLRARWYDSLSGRFNRMDPFAGSPQDPQSLHKYLYCHANPVNMVDPSGLMTFVGTMKVIAITSVIANIALTVYSGIRHNLSAKIIGWNIIQNLAIFALIAGVFFASTPFAIAAGVTLAVASGFGLYNLITQWKNMDGIDKLIVFGQILTYCTFSFAMGGIAASRLSGSSSGAKPLDWQKVVKQSGKNKGETRIQHVRKHNTNNINKPQHGVFEGDGFKITNQAWSQKGNIKPNSAGGVDVYDIPYKNAGWAGGSMGSGATLNTVRVITVHGTTDLITAYPITP
jgi:RHS repeat-associated protein